MEDKRKTAAFLDMDGTVIVTKSGHDFPEGIHDWKFNKNIGDQLKEIASKFDFIFIVSNQGGIEEKFVTHTDVRAKFDTIKDIILEDFGVKIQEILFSPYNSYHYNRKPNPEFAYRMAIKYQLDMQKCIMIGDASGIHDRRLVGHIDFTDNLHFLINEPGQGWNSLVPVELHGRVYIETSPSGVEMKYIDIRKDFSDSDKKFAENSGMKYMDIEKLLTRNWPISDLMFYAK